MPRYELKRDISKDELNSFVWQSDMENLLQSYDWGSVKEGWKSIYTGFYKDSNLIGTAMILKKPLPLGLSMLYIPRGPVADYTNAEDTKAFLDALKKLGKDEGAVYIKMDPQLIRKAYHKGEEAEVLPGYDEKFENIINAGAKHLGYTEDFSATVQPRFNMNELETDYNPELFSKKTKKNLKIAEKKGIEVKTGGMDLLDGFSEVMAATENRKGIALRDKEYFKKLLETYGNDAFITLGILDLEKSYKEAKARLEKCQSDLAKLPENQKKKRFTLQEQETSLLRQVKDLKEEMDLHGSQVTVCGTLTVVFHRSAEILYAGMNDAFRRYMGPYLVWTKTMEECYARGCKWANMGGVEGSLEGGLSDFKSGFNPTVWELAGEFDLPVSPLMYAAAKRAYDIRKRRLSSRNEEE